MRSDQKFNKLWWIARSLQVGNDVRWQWKVEPVIIFLLGLRTKLEIFQRFGFGFLMSVILPSPRLCKLGHSNGDGKKLIIYAQEGLAKGQKRSLSSPFKLILNYTQLVAYGFPNDNCQNYRQFQWLLLLRLSVYKRVCEHWGSTIYKQEGNQIWLNYELSYKFYRLIVRIFFLLFLSLNTTVL